MVLLLRWHSVVPNHDDLMCLFARFVDKALLDSMLHVQFAAIL